MPLTGAVWMLGSRSLNLRFRLRPPLPVQTSADASPTAPLVKPLLLSKVNTVLQLALVAGALTHMG